MIAFRRGVFTEQPSPGDFVLSTTGVSWNVDRTTVTGSVLRLIAGEPDRKGALQRLVDLAKADGAVAWEALGGGAYRLIVLSS
jgi:hypothetical protein